MRFRDGLTVEGERAALLEEREQLLQQQKAALEAERDRLLRRAAPERLLAFIRTTQPGYQAGRFHQMLCEKLEAFLAAVERGESPRLLISAPPRHGKTVIVSQGFPDWAMSRVAGLEIAVASYAQELADDNSRAARTVARSQEMVEVFGRGVLPGRVGKNRQTGGYQRADVDKITLWQMGNRSSYKAVGVGGPLTGRGARVLIVDDPIKGIKDADSARVREEIWNWYQTDASTRVAPGGGVIVMCTRWHQEDLIGKLLAHAAANPEADQWEYINLPAIAEEPIASYDWREPGEALDPTRWPAQVLLRRRASMALRFWLALYQGTPTSSTGGLFKRAYFKRYQERPNVLVHKMSEVGASIDCTFKAEAGSDRVSIQVWGRKDDAPAERYLFHEVTARMDIVETIRALKVVLHNWPMVRYLLVEDTANGPAIIRLLKGVYNIIPFSPTKHGSKASRAQVAAVCYEAGNVYHPLPEYAPWIEAYEEELADFGTGARHDDRVDAASQIMIRWEPEARQSTFDDFAAYFTDG